MIVKAKICGLSTPETIAAAISGGAAYIGFVFYEKSPRYVTPKQALELGNDVPQNVNKVALCVDSDDETLSDIVKICSPDMLQLHGQESPERVRHIQERFARPVIKAVQLSTVGDIKDAREFEDTADILLFDAKPSAGDSAALPGGNAQPFDWSLLSGQTWKCPWMLSGGLTAQNVPSAVKQTSAPMVDVSSGVESTRGIKDVNLIKEFLETVGRL